MVVIFANRILIDMGILLELLFHTLFKNKSCCDKQNLILIFNRTSLYMVFSSDFSKSGARVKLYRTFPFFPLSEHSVKG